MLTDEFRKAKSPQIEYEGKTVVLYDTIDVPEEGTMVLRFQGGSSEWRQGVRIGDLSPGTDLVITVAGRSAPGMQLWQDACPSEVEIAFVAPQKKVTVYNIWDSGDGQSRSQLMGSGMHREISEDGRTRTYQCNDGHAETVFSHLVFSLEVL